MSDQSKEKLREDWIRGVAAEIADWEREAYGPVNLGFAGPSASAEQAKIREILKRRLPALSSVEQEKLKEAESKTDLGGETPIPMGVVSEETGDAPDRITKMRKALELVYEEHMQFGWGWDHCHDAVIEALGGSDFVNAWNRGVFGRSKRVEEVHTAHEWDKILNTQILDWDGFRDGTITTESRITRGEFELRAVHATRRAALIPSGSEPNVDSVSSLTNASSVEQHRGEEGEQ